MSFTYHPKKRKRQRAHGFRRRKQSRGGKKILSRRRGKKRWELTV